MGASEEVHKIEKLKQNVGKNPKSRYHIECYEAHLVKVQILTLKVYKKLFNDIQTWKENCKSSNQRDVTEDDIRTSTLIATKRNHLKIASELLKLWKRSPYISFNPFHCHESAQGPKYRKFRNLTLIVSDS